MHLSGKLRSPVIALLAILAGLASITHQSFWMDEGSTIFKALIPGLGEWWRMTLHLGGSDVQMPVYMFLVWAWEKLGPASEYSLRAVNLPWLVIGALALRRIRFWPLVFLTSPFVLYYTGELRPYTMQAAAGAMAAAAFLRIRSGIRASQPFEGLHHAAFAAMVLAASSLTGAVWATGLAAGILLLRPEWLGSGGFWKRILPWLPIAALLIGFYGYTLIKGYRAAGGEGGISSILFGCYELMGLLGLGPGRNEIRANPICILRALPWLAPAAILLGAVWLRGTVAMVRNSSRRDMIAAAAAILIPLFILTSVSVLLDFRVLGRHLSPLVAVFLLPIAVCLDPRVYESIRWPIAAAGALCLALLSTLLLRTREIHFRDDYRSASAIAFKALEDGKRVWWQADMNATRYYAYRRGGFPMVGAIQSLESDVPSSLLAADMVFINRPDIRYHGQDYRAELKRNYFHLETVLTGFEIWSSN